MADTNIVVVSGRLGNDPEPVKGEARLVKFHIACNRGYFDKEEKWIEKTNWLPIVVTGKSGDACMDYLRKGSPVLVHGNLEYRSWETEEGKKMVTYQVMTNSVQFLGGRSNDKE